MLYVNNKGSDQTLQMPGWPEPLLFRCMYLLNPLSVCSNPFIFICMVNKGYEQYYTVNPLYNGIRYNSKIRYNVNSVCTKKSADRAFFH